MTKKTAPKRDYHQEITATIIAQIEAGEAQFEMPWHRIAKEKRLPFNKTTSAEYRGINTLVLGMSGFAHETNGWASFKQWKARGRWVKKGERGTPVVFFSTFKRDPKDQAEQLFADADGKVDQAFAKFGNVFNEDQLQDYEPLEDRANAMADTMPDQVTALDDCDAFLASTGAEIRETGGRACYSPTDDVIHMPRRELFTGTSSCSPTEAFYATAFHELTHWTGHSSRLDRFDPLEDGREAYAFEELVAELGAAFLCCQLGISIEPRPDHAAYLAGWLTLLRKDKRAIFRAAAKAQKAVDHVMSLQPQTTQQNEKVAA